MNSKIKAYLFFTLLLTSSVSGCLSEEALESLESENPCTSEIQVRESDGTLKILTYDIAGFSDELIAQFTDETGVQVEFIRTDDAGGILDQMMLTKSTPLADLMIGLDNTYLPTAIENCLLQPHTTSAANLSASASAFYDGPLAVPFDQGDVCLNYDEDALSEAYMSVPTHLSDLTEDEWKVQPDFPPPVTSSTALE